MLKIKAEADFKNLNGTEVEIFKNDGTVLNVNNDITSSIKVKLKTKNGAKTISGEKEITVTWTEQPAFAKKQLRDLNTTVSFTSLKTIDAFKTKLIEKAKHGKSNLNTLTVDNVDILKAANNVLTNPDDIQSASFIIKAKTDDSTFIGQQSVTVAWTEDQVDLKTLLSTNVNVSATLNDIEDFKNELVKVFKIAELTIDKIIVKKYDGSTATNLDTNDIIAQSFDIQISVSADGASKFKGSQVITVNLTAENSKQKYLNNLTTNITVNALSRNLTNFKTELVNALKSANSNFTNLDVNKIKIEKNNGFFWRLAGLRSTTLTDNDIVNGQINIKISVDTDGTSDFKGSQDITVTLTTK